MAVAPYCAATDNVVIIIPQVQLCLRPPHLGSVTDTLQSKENQLQTVLKPSSGDLALSC